MKIDMTKNLTIKLAAAGLVGVIASTGLVACSKTGKGSTTTTTDISIVDVSNDEIDNAAIVAGGWNVAEDQTITPELKSVFDNALEDLIGVKYEPVAYMASQVVAGTNHCFLCKATVVRPGVTPKYTLIYIYEDPDKDCRILNFKDVEMPGTDGDGEKVGGWTISEKPEITADLASAVEKAASKKLGAKYVPIANIASQVVSGTNHAIICKITPVAPDAKASFAIVTVYENLEGECEITNIKDITISAQD